jgi:hypothetical protein
MIVISSFDDLVAAWNTTCGKEKVRIEVKSCFGSYFQQDNIKEEKRS